ncbi:MAG: carboxypeptidase regulatory-like domain-containing protein [Bacteroidaceae bacterium]|nr:carboxypeptidase regulatory-like domain-containing protein [Bacteroidaceae bacterium]
MKRLLFLMQMLIAFAAGVSAQEVVATFDFVANPWEHAQGFGSQGQDSYDQGNITEPLVAPDYAATLAFDNTGASTPARFWNSTGQVRVYSGAKATITAPTGKAISKIAVTATASNYLGTPEPFIADGSVATATLAEAVESYTFTANANARWTKIEVTLVPATSGGGEDPAPSPTGSIEISKSNSASTGFPISAGADAASQKAQFIYPASMLTDLVGKEITEIKLHLSDAGSIQSSGATEVINLAEVDATAFSSAAFLTADFTNVYNATAQTVNGSKEWVFTLSSPYVYEGGNLLVQMETNNPSGMLGSPNFYGTTQSGNVGYISYTEFGYSESKLSKYLPMMTVTYQEAVTPDPEDPSEPTVATFDFYNNPWGKSFGNCPDDTFTASDGATTISFIPGGTSTYTIQYKMTDNQLRVYKDDKIVIKAPAGKAISQLDFVYASSYDGGLGSSIKLDEPAATQTLTLTGNARWTKIDVTLVPGSDDAGGDAGGFEIPEGYAETANYTYNFDDLKTKSLNGSSGVDPSQLALGWGYASQQTTPGGFFGYSTYTYHSGKAPYLANKSAEPLLDYFVTPAVKGAVKLFVRNYSTSSSYDGKQYLKFYKVTKNEDGTFTAPAADAEPFFTKEFTLSESSWAELEIANLEDYEYIAFTGSYCYFDDFSAEYAVMPENPALQVIEMTTEVAQGGNIYADETGKGTWTGSIKVKNTGNVDLVAGRTNYSVTVTSQSTSSVTIPETIIPISVDLAQGEETEIPLEIECQIVDLSKDGWTAIRATSNIIEYGLKNTDTKYYKQSPWFYVKNYSPKISVKEGVVGALDSYVLPFGLVSGSGSKTVTITNDGGSDAVITAIETTIPEGFSHNAELPLTIAKGETADVVLTIGGAEGYKEGTVTITYGNGLTFTTKKLSATIIAEGTYLETFGTQLSPASSYVPSGWINQNGSSWEADASSSNVYMKSGNQTYKTEMLVSPKITFAEGQVLTAGVGVGTTYMSGSSTDVYLQIYYSTDRENWQLANVLAYSTSKKSATTDIYGNSIDASKVTTWGSFDGSGIGNAKAFTIDGIPAGDYYIGFNSGYTQIDYIFGGKLAELENDLYLTSYSVNAGQSMVNNPISATVSYTNMMNATAPARTVALYDGETLIEEKAGADLEAYGSETVEFTFTPHAVGTMNLQVKISNVEGDYSVATETKSVNVKEETMVGEKLVGERTSNAAGVAPISLYYYNSHVEWIWDAEHLGLNDGDKINSLTFYYYTTSKDLPGKKLRIYMVNTEDSKVGSAFYNGNTIEQMTLTPVFSSDNYTYPKAGSSSDHAEMKFTLDNDFVYTGNNIRVIVISEDYAHTAEASGSFEYYNSTTGTMAYNRSDTNSTYENATSMNTSTNVPVATLGLSVTAPVLSGIITEAGDALAGATVEAKSGEVVYTATTDADGKYSMEIMQPSLEYVVTVTADGYDPFVSEAMTIAENTVLDHDFFNGAIVKINSTIGYSTFYDSEHAVKIPEGVTPYVFGLSLTANEMALVSYADYLEAYDKTYENVVQAGEAVVLMGSGDVALEYTTSSLPLIEDNWLSGFDTPATTTVSAYWSYMDYTDADCYFYALTLNKDKDPDSVGFYWMNETGAPFVSAAHKAYLSIPMDAFSSFAGGDAFVKGIPFHKDATAIKNVNANRNDGQMYNIAGQRVNGNVKGIVIKNGKKFMVK